MFPRDGLQPRVEFWKSVFTAYSESQLIFHDVKHVHLVYRTIDLATEGISNDDTVGRRSLETRHREQIAQMLRNISEGKNNEWDQDSLNLAKAIDASNVADRPEVLAERIHVQRGIREKFAEGLKRYSNYRETIEAILRAEQIPDGLAALPLVESAYLNVAVSRTGAAGIWQFMPSTARLFMNVNARVDERLDPEIATRSAARLLRRNHDSLGSWPLAISAYNHGLTGLKRAKELCGAVIHEIINCYQGSSFGYASMNFYPEFLAALDLLEDYRAMSAPVLSIAGSSSSRAYRVRKGDTLSGLARQFRTTTQQIMALNGMKDPGRLVAGRVIAIPKG